MKLYLKFYYLIKGDFVKNIGMTLIYGCWKLDDEGIEHIGENGYGYFISKDRLDSKGYHNKEENVYNWLIHLLEKLWLSNNDIFDFNHIFLIALGYFNIPVNKERFDNTLEMQKKLMINR